jgi:hypothetical protein
MNDQAQKKQLVSMTRGEMNCNEMAAIETVLGEMLINTAAIIDDPVAMLSVAKAATQTYHHALESYGLTVAP